MVACSVNVDTDGSSLYSCCNAELLAYNLFYITESVSRPCLIVPVFRPLLGSLDCAEDVFVTLEDHFVQVPLLSLPWLWWSCQRVFTTNGSKWSIDWGCCWARWSCDCLCQPISKNSCQVTVECHPFFNWFFQIYFLFLLNFSFSLYVQCLFGFPFKFYCYNFKTLFLFLIFSAILFILFSVIIIFKILLSIILYF